jgi:uncharacterized C2H2 Zn-finger protein
MATEMIRRVWCDRCLVETDKRVEAQRSETITLGDVKRSLDLCDPCAVILLDPLVDLLKRAGNPIAPTVKLTSRAGKCPECGQSFTARKSLIGHLRSQHGMTLGEAGRVTGGTIPCPQCDYLALDKVGLARHVRFHQEQKR